MGIHPMGVHPMGIQVYVPPGLPEYGAAVAAAVRADIAKTEAKPVQVSQWLEAGLYCSGACTGLYWAGGCHAQGPGGSESGTAAHACAHSPPAAMPPMRGCHHGIVLVASGRLDPGDRLCQPNSNPNVTFILT